MASRDSSAKRRSRSVRVPLGPNSLKPKGSRKSEGKTSLSVVPPESNGNMTDPVSWSKLAEVLLEGLAAFIHGVPTNVLSDQPVKAIGAIALLGGIVTLHHGSKGADQTLCYSCLAFFTFIVLCLLILALRGPSNHGRLGAAQDDRMQAIQPQRIQ